MSCNLSKILLFISLWTTLYGTLIADEVSVSRPVTSYVLANGLKVLLYSDPQASHVTVNVVYKTGAKHENPGEYGMAHLLEHLAFQNTKNFRDIPKECDRRGGRLNANTNADRTTYYETLPASLENLEFLLAMEADRMTQADLNEAAIDREKDAVQKEWDMSSRSGFQPLLKEMLQMAYPQHAYGRDTLGIEDGILQSRAVALRNFYARRYIPQRAVLSVGGAFVPEDARRLIEKYWGALPAGVDASEEPPRRLQPQSSERLVIIPRPGGPAYVGVLYRAMPGADASYVSAQALVHCLSSHPESLLQKKLVRSGPAREVFGFVQQSVDEGFIAFMARPRAGRDPLQVAQRLAELLESQARACQQQDLERFQKENAAAWTELAQDTRAFTMQLGEFEVLGDARLMQDEERQSQRLRLEDLKSVSRWLSRSNRTMGVLDPRSPHSLAGRRASP